MEHWLPIHSHVGLYEVSDLGRIRSLGRTTADGRRVKGRVLKGRPQKSGHLSVQLAVDGVHWNALIHRLVLTAFAGPPPAGMHALHMDGDPENNTLTNLRWGTPSENSLDAVRHGAHPQARKTHCKKGHPFTAENTRFESRGGRACRACDRERPRRRNTYQQKKAA